MSYHIESITTVQALSAAYGLFHRVFRGAAVVDNPHYALAQWEARLQSGSGLLLHTLAQGAVIGIAFGRAMDDCSMILGPVAVHAAHRGCGVARKMVQLLEQQAAQKGLHSVHLGAAADAEGFYEKLGYQGALLIQSSCHTIGQLLAVPSAYPVISTGIYANTVSQVYLACPRPDRALQQVYEAALPGCHTMMHYRKDIRA